MTVGPTYQEINRLTNRVTSKVACMQLKTPLHLQGDLLLLQHQRLQNKRQQQQHQAPGKEAELQQVRQKCCRAATVDAEPCSELVESWFFLFFFFEVFLQILNSLSHPLLLFFLFFIILCFEDSGVWKT